MAVSESFLAFVVEQLDDVRDVTSRRMFGGVGLYSGEWFFAVLDNDTLFFKVNETTVGQYKRRRMGPFRPYPTGPANEGYYQVPLSVLEDRDALNVWARQAVTVSQAAKGKRRRRR